MRERERERERRTLVFLIHKKNEKEESQFDFA